MTMAIQRKASGYVVRACGALELETRALCDTRDSSRKQNCDRSDVSVTEGRPKVSPHCCVGSSGTKFSVVVLTVVTTEVHRCCMLQLSYTTPKCSVILELLLCVLHDFVSRI